MIGRSRTLRRGLVTASALAGSLFLAASITALAAAPAGVAGSATSLHRVAPVSSGTASPSVTPAGGLGLDLIVNGLDQPLYVTNAGDARLFVVERPGRIRILKHIGSAWQVSGTFLDIRARVRDSSDEQGLLGLAFPPDYASSGRFYVYYVNNSGAEVLSEFRRQSADVADATSERTLLTIDDPFTNHNGGWIAFKQGESNLYIGTGDGGSAGDPGQRAQNTDVLLGKILRISPRDPDGSGPKHYGIPHSNPFVGKPGRDAIYAYGLRNPWRNSFDPLTGDLWIGDVGQDRYEEIDHVASGSGVNFGWNRLEGRHLYASGTLCSSNCKRLPVAEYKHVVGGEDNCSVTGGYVIRREGAPLYGQYVFGDFCSGRIWHVPTSFNSASLPAAVNTDLNLSSFGLGNDLTVYAVDINGAIYSVSGS